MYGSLITIDELFLDHRHFHSDLQMDYFITGKSGGTLYGCYKQALRELKTRFDTLREQYAQIAQLEADIEALQSPADKKASIALTKNELALSSQLAVTQDMEREFIRFYGQAVALRKKMTEQGVEFPLSDEATNRLDYEMWVHRIKCMAAAQYLGGALSTSVIETVHAFPVEQRKSLMEQIAPASREKLVDWYMNYDVQLPEPARLTREEVFRAVGNPDRLYLTEATPAKSLA